MFRTVTVLSMAGGLLAPPALTGVDLMANPELLAAARADFLERSGGRPYRSPIPADQPPPLPWLVAILVLPFGTCFRIGLWLVQRIADDTTPWMWGVNGL